MSVKTKTLALVALFLLSFNVVSKAQIILFGGIANSIAGVSQAPTSCTYNASAPSVVIYNSVIYTCGPNGQFSASGSSGTVTSSGSPVVGNTACYSTSTNIVACTSASNYPGNASTAMTAVGLSAPAQTGAPTVVASTNMWTANQPITGPSFISNGSGPWLYLTERANAITPAAGSDFCDQDSTAHGILCSMNGGVAQGVVTGGTCGTSQSCSAPLAKPLHIWSGSFTFSSTSQAVTGLATLCPTAILSVWASSQSHAYAYQISSISTAGFTITTTSNTDVWNWGAACY